MCEVDHPYDVKENHSGSTLLLLWTGFAVLFAYHCLDARGGSDFREKPINVANHRDSNHGRPYAITEALTIRVAIEQ